jgi:hypothetical protein
MAGGVAVADGVGTAGSLPFNGHDYDRPLKLIKAGNGGFRSFIPEGGNRILIGEPLSFQSVILKKIRRNEGR